MNSMKPDYVHTEFARVFAARGLEALVSLCEEDTKFINMGGTEVQGTGIRAALQGFLTAAGSDSVMTMETNYVSECGDLAMLSNTWLLKATGPDGKPLEMTGKTVEVARKQADGGWLMVIDNPAGAM